MNKKAYGFTIVELLIVIVVIAILAAISIVAYNGIQNRANDIAVQNDLSAFAKKVRLEEAKSGTYLPAGASVGNIGAFPNFTFLPSKTSYNIDILNLVYCTGLKAGERQFVITAQSKTTTLFIYDSKNGTSSISTGARDPRNVCTSGWDASTLDYSYGHLNSPSRWWGWTDGP